MNSKVTYLSSRSLAVYETMLIEDYGQQYKRDVRLQRCKLGLLWLCFTALAFSTLALPLLIQDFLHML